jgi:Mlc titration factor MtfA (ptsG expression regulator)
MIMSWLSRWRGARERRALRRRAIPDRLWDLTIARYPFLARRIEADRLDLRRLATLFLDRKEFAGAQGFIVTDEVAVAVAAQACLPVLRLGLHLYDGFIGIVIHPQEVVARREIVDTDGVVHEYDEHLTGEAMDGGPMMLSWHDVAMSGETAAEAYNVVIHEFVHVIDMLDGAADGVPPIADRAARERWAALIAAEYAAFCRNVEGASPTVLDPYGATALEEFFAVAAEAFFVVPDAMCAEHPELYRAFADWFRQDPAGT